MPEWRPAPTFGDQMKFKCINDKELKLFGGFVKVDGITAGKEYLGQFIGWGQFGTTALVIFNDKNEWQTFTEVSRFEPVF